MSRSRKKIGIIKDNGKSKKYWKKQANKKARKVDVPDGGAYKKQYDQYELCDYKFTEWRLKNSLYYNEYTEERDLWLQKVFRK